MRSHSSISAAALAVALIATVPASHAQLLGVDLNLGGESGIDAGVSVGGDSLLDVDVDAGSGSSDDLLDVEVGGSGADDSLVDVAVGGGPATGPNGGTLIDLGVGTDEAVLDADVTLGGATGGAGLINGDVRIGALEEGEERSAALLRLIETPNLADIDLDATIDDRRVSIVTAAELLGSDDLARIDAAIASDGAGRGELREALSASVELGAILENEGIELEDVLAVQIAEDGAAEVIVLGGDVVVAALGDNGDLAGLTAGEAAELDIDLLSREELAEVDLDLLPDDLRSTAQLRLLGVESPAASEPTPADLAAVDLDLLSDEELGELDIALLPEPVGAAVRARLLGAGDAIGELSVRDLASVDLDLATEGGDGSGGEAGPDAGGTATAGDGDDDTGVDGGADDGSDSGATGDDEGGASDGETNVAAAPDGAIAPASGVTAAPVPRGASGGSASAFGIAALDCEIGVLALANGVEATPQAIAGAESLELVQIEGCERGLVDADVDQVHSAISSNRAISDVLEDAQIPLDEVIGATVQAETLTLFIEAATES